MSNSFREGKELLRKLATQYPNHLKMEDYVDFPYEDEPKRREEVGKHLMHCRGCYLEMVEHIDSVSSISGFNPETGERYKLDFKWVIAGPFSPETLSGRKFSETDKDVSLSFDVVDGVLLATLLIAGIPASDAEIRLEVRGAHESDNLKDGSKFFDLFAWNMTKESGSCDLGPSNRLVNVSDDLILVIGVNLELRRSYMIDPSFPVVTSTTIS